jgi:hypothetical protein
VIDLIVGVVHECKDMENTNILQIFSEIFLSLLSFLTYPRAQKNNKVRAQKTLSTDQSKKWWMKVKKVIKKLADTKNNI